MEISQKNLVGLALQVIDKEAQAVNNLKNYIDDEFVEIVNLYIIQRAG